jgi:uncharacterized protein
MQNPSVSVTRSQQPRLTRRRFLLAAGATGVLGSATGVYARWVEPRWVEVVRRDLPLANLPAALTGRTLAHISDLHVGTTDEDHLAACLRTVSELAPDMVAITGDFMTCAGLEQADRVPGVLAALSPPPLGCFAVLGNHDYGHGWNRADAADLLTKRVTDCGVTVLRNRRAEVAGLAVVGVDDLWASRTRPTEAVAGLSSETPAIALCHNPDGADRDGWGDFRGWVLAGHTHGGQCKPPFLPPPVTHLRNRRYAAGEVDLGNGRRMYVNRGLGYVQKVRFNARPEITLLTLVPAVA